jgi:hypothetical protein
MFVFHLYKAVMFIATDTATVIELGLASADMHVKDLGPEGVHADEQLPADGSASAQNRLVEVETAPTHEITVCNVVLVSCRTGAIDRDAVRGPLTKCLQDVGFISLTLYLLHACC